MTTIAIDTYGNIAADGLATLHDDITDRDVEKLRIRHGRIYAMAGTAAFFEPLIGWHHAYKADPERAPKVSDPCSWTLLVVERIGLVTKYSSTCLYPETFKPPYTLGAGCDHAMGAMLAGASAAEAVQLVADRCIHTGGRILCYDIAKELGPYMPALATLEAAE